MKAIFVIAALALLLAACGPTEQPTPAPTTPSAPTQAAPTPAVPPVQPVPTPAVPPVQPVPTPAAKLTDLTSVFGMSGSFKCTARMDTGQGTFYVKNGKVRTDAVAQGTEAHSVFDGDDIWTWSAQGCYHVKLSEIQAMMQSMPQAKPATRDEMAQSAADVDCQATSVDDSMFAAPSPCQDMSELLKQAQQYQR
ncbi:hypothetical protein HY642_01970 [Candidatus Woesearchaeota archaeon]|nr:hypothetical protein [Candidatus Woesearchaeota archaeon]